MSARERWTTAVLDRYKLQGDPAADDALDALLAAQPDGGLRALQQAFSFLRPLSDNAALDALSEAPAVAPHGAAALAAACTVLPPWADQAKIARAEQLFREGGVISCVLFFCASLPEVYVAPDISALLHVTGDLERTTDQRIRATSAMILSVLLPGGLIKSSGAGRAKVFKARFVHAAMRRLFLRENPSAMAGRPALVPPLGVSRQGASPLERAWAHGWNASLEGLPCNQEEQSYTLLTFGYVYLRSLRRLGLGLSAADEEAYLHLWNVAGSLMGIDDGLLAHTMADAHILFERLQIRAGRRVQRQDARPMLAGALIDSIEKSITQPWLRPAGALLVRYLSSARTARQLGLTRRYDAVSRLLFGAALGAVKAFDALLRIARPRFSLLRFILRVAGYRLVRAVLTDMSNPIDLPEAVRQEVNAMLDEWSCDNDAPAWLNQAERYFTTRQAWRMSIGV